MNETKNTQLNLLWLRAAVLGAVWASSEIILGSFLHNLRLPFSGACLSAIGVYLLSAFDAKWRHNGVLWRAGIICALMKSVSPSAVIFGPMIAITAEALLFTGMVRLFGRNFIGYGIGGALAVAWSLFHKIISMVITYGPDIVTIYSNLYKYAGKVTSLRLGDPAMLIGIMFGGYCLLGVIVALAGSAAGKKVVPVHLEYDSPENYTWVKPHGGSPFTGHSLLWLSLQIVFMVAGLFIISEYELPYAAGVVALVTLVNLIRYRGNLKKRLRLKFWIELAVITTLAGFFMGGLKNAQWSFTLESFADGLGITLRALLLTQCFGLLGIELANPAVKSFFMKWKMKKLIHALEAAFMALPLMLAMLSSHKDKFKTPSKLIAGFITLADEWITENSALGLNG